jgi:ABC-2 type transport system ATP-binding protein
MIEAKNITMKFNLNKGKVRTLKEKLLVKNDEIENEKSMFCALDEVSFSVEKGEIFGIIGGNGAGKSTLLKILAGIMKPTSGEVKISGSIAPMIELGTGFDYELSAQENIYLSGAILGYSKKFIDSKVASILDFSELWDFKDVPIKFFSSGMVARLAFSVATLVTPDILIVDEILSVGDLGFQKKSYERMKNLMNSGSTVVYVSHDVKTLSEMCSRVMWLEKGKIKMLGEPKKVCDYFINNI